MCGDPVTLEAGSGFAGYTILGEVGRGGMGTVYAAQHPRLPRHDALKVLNPELSGNEDFRQRFIREADIAAQLDHPNIVHVYDRGEIDGQLWIATQFIDGVDVSRLLHARYPAGMPAGEALPIIRATAAALDYAHSHGMLHRDVKPANILLSQPRPDGQRQVYLADFGIARPLTDPNGLTATNLTLGTVAYAAPEQLMGAAVDPQADQYALACTAFHLLTGAPPYTDPNSVAVISQHLNAPVPMLSNRRPDLGAMNAVFGKALAKNPRDRFGSCTEFAAALEQVAGTGALGYGFTQAGMTMAAPPAISHPLRSVKRRDTRRKVVIPAVALTGIGAVVAAGVYFVSNRESVDQHRLDGTYRWVADRTAQRRNGLPPTAPLAEKEIISFGAYRSDCSKTGCVATETELDPQDPTKAKVPGENDVAHFVDGSWVFRFEFEKSCADEGEPELPGRNTVSQVTKLQEQGDGTFRGTLVQTVLTSECGHRGFVYDFPFVGTRTGDIPPGVDVLNPAEASPRPVPIEPESSPTLNGLYRVEYGSNTSSWSTNGEGRSSTKPADAGLPPALAVKSACASGRCVATALFGEAAIPEADVFDLVAGRWQTQARLYTPSQCPKGSGYDDKAERLAFTRSFAVESDGSLKGAMVMEVSSNECGPVFADWKNILPFTATRVGDIPPQTVLADPTLFLS